LSSWTKFHFWPPFLISFDLLSGEKLL
jgi:hypothetical protein